MNLLNEMRNDRLKHRETQDTNYLIALLTYSIKIALYYKHQSKKPAFGLCFSLACCWFVCVCRSHTPYDVNTDFVCECVCVWCWHDQKKAKRWKSKAYRSKSHFFEQSAIFCFNINTQTRSTQKKTNTAKTMKYFLSVFFLVVYPPHVRHPAPFTQSQ